MIVCTILMGCACSDNKGVKTEVKTEKSVEYVYTYRYFWLRQGYAINGGDYVAQGLHDAFRPHLAAGIGRIEEAMGGLVKFVEVKNMANADFVVSGVQLQEKGVLAFWDSRSKLICINLNAQSGSNLGVVLAHEILHMCGLGHSADPRSIMYWSCGDGVAIMTKEDRDNLRKILEGTSL